jgi:class 3 adenylate cyclase
LQIHEGLFNHAPRQSLVRQAHAANDDLVSASAASNPTAPPGGGKVVGIHAGILMAEPSTPPWQEYSVIGETVNLASRLESLNKQFKTELLMSAAAYEIVRGDFTGFVSLGEAKVAGIRAACPRLHHYPAQAVEAAAVRQEYAV